MSKLRKNEKSTDDLVKHAITLRERAVEALLCEHQEVHEKIDNLQRQLVEIDKQLARLSGRTERKSRRGPRKVLIHASHRSAKSGLVEKRYKSLWPLPGGRKKYAGRLMAILSRISTTTSSLDDLTDWVMREYEIGDWAEHSILNCVIYPGFAKRDGSKVRLTQEGERFLATGDQIIIGGCLEENIWGIREMLEWLGSGPITLEDLHQRFNEHGAGWQGTAQVKYRLDWMIVAGRVLEDKGCWPTLYSLRWR